MLTEEALTKLNGTQTAAPVFTAQQSGGTSGSGGGGVPVRTPTGAVTAAKSEHGEVSITPKNAAKGSTVMIKAVPKEGYALKTIAVTDQNGKPVAVTEKDGSLHSSCLRAMSRLRLFSRDSLLEM